MENPWTSIRLEDYENHMKLEQVKQLQGLNQMMKEQMERYPVSTVMILGIAGGNGLNHIKQKQFEAVYGVDINRDYLTYCNIRYPELKSIFHGIHADLMKPDLSLPNAQLVIANLLVEYIGYQAFADVISCVKPQYVSCIFQVNGENGFVSDSPYIHKFDQLSEVHHTIMEPDLDDTMKQIGYCVIERSMKSMPNDKTLQRIDYNFTGE